jgi:hypothetical protein
MILHDFSADGTPGPTDKRDYRIKCRTFLVLTLLNFFLCCQGPNSEQFSFFVTHKCTQ